MIFGRNRVEEDLEKIRHANLPDENLKKKTKTDDDGLKLEKGDMLAMILAVMSLVLPYVIAFVVIMAAVIFLLGYLY